ncbi:MAG TPA: hypothetical protein K8V94_09520, partial [Corynebacterium amycolatum]|nr:hypothetical protein [Corynebacterium amycolatum]
MQAASGAVLPGLRLERGQVGEVAGLDLGDGRLDELRDVGNADGDVRGRDRHVDGRLASLDEQRDDAGVVLRRSLVVGVALVMCSVRLVVRRGWGSSVGVRGRATIRQVAAGDGLIGAGDGVADLGAAGIEGGDGERLALLVVVVRRVRVVLRRLLTGNLAGRNLGQVV